MRAARGREPGGRPTQGFALPAALFALLVIAALAAGLGFAALQEIRAGGNSRLAESAFEAAEAGLARALAAGRAGAWGQLGIGDSVVSSGSLPAGTAGFVTTVRRLNGRLFLVRSAGADRGDVSRRLLGLVVRRGAVSVRPAAALAAAGAVEIEVGSTVDGRDADPPGWGACAGVARDTVPGLALPPGTLLRTDSACGGRTCLAGDPPAAWDSAISDSTLRGPAGLDWDHLARMAGKVYPAVDGGVSLTPGPVGSLVACDRNEPANWGEPARPATVPGCQGYFPVILVRGDLTLSSGRGQGVLLVEGDLTVTGGAEFVGAVLVGGSLRSNGAGGRFFGSVAVAGRGAAEAVRLEGVSIVFSSCGLTPALGEIGPPEPLPERSWAYLY